MSEHSERIIQYSKAGADGVFDVTAPGRDGLGSDLDPLLEALRSRLRHPAPEPELRALDEALPRSGASTIIMYCLRNGSQQLNVSAVASTFGMAIRTLRKRLRRAEFPGCDALIRAGRHLTMVESARRHPHWSREELARCFGFQTAASLRMSRWRLLRTLGAHGGLGRRLRELLDPSL